MSRRRTVEVRSLDVDERYLHDSPRVVLRNGQRCEQLHCFPRWHGCIHVVVLVRVDLLRDEPRA
eukprot:8533635-Heterocapsa_arctica.AAC.1